MALSALGQVTVVGHSLGSVTSEIFSNLSDSVIFKQLNCSRKEGCSSFEFFSIQVQKCHKVWKAREKSHSNEAGLLEF